MRTYSLHEYFYYTRLERNAAIILGLLCVSVFFAPLSFLLFFKADGKAGFVPVQQTASAILPVPVAEKAGGFVASRRGTATEAEAETFAFDPNTASKDDLVRLGLSARTAQTVLNYRDKGGRFYKKEDLQKIYGLREEDYQRLQAWAQFPERGREANNFSKSTDNQANVTAFGNENQPSSTPQFAKKNSAVLVDINRATAEDWQQIRGIGPGWARRIVNFREKLGGFTSPQQVSETFGLPDSVFQEMLPQLQAGSPVFRPIKINSATLDELKKHPYLSSFQATVIFNYRVQHGNFTDFASVKKVKAGFKDEDWQRLELYFSFE
ncbi:MAG: helix-hairpin-helix domain-containing protein [Bacteroidetes bacterium]|nr:helix-hairpin-helix domain-containing protein [Bacteroidota bacterium]